MSAITDKASDFWARISPRERRIVIMGAVALPLIIALWLGLAIHDGLDAMEQRNDKMRKALAVLADLEARGPRQPADDTIATMGVEPVSLDTYLTNAAQKAGFVLAGTQPRNPVTRAGFVTNSVSCHVNDVTLDQLTKFLQQIEGPSRVVVVTHLDVHRRLTQGKDKLEATLEVSTYSKEPPPKGEGSGSASGSGDDKKKGG
jgi:type II secretory pathway component PulM